MRNYIESCNECYICLENKGSADCLCINSCVVKYTRNFEMIPNIEIQQLKNEIDVANRKIIKRRYENEITTVNESKT